MLSKMHKGIIKYGLALLLAYNLSIFHYKYKELEKAGLEKEFYNKNLEVIIKNEEHK